MITGGSTSVGNVAGAGIGGGGGTGNIHGGDGGTVLILGGNVTVTEGTGGGGAVDIGGGKGPPNGDGGAGQGIRPNNDGAYSVYGNLELPCDITIPDGVKVTVPGGISLTVPKDVTLTVEEGGVLENNGTISGKGKLAGYGTLTNNGQITDEIKNSIPNDSWIAMDYVQVNGKDIEVPYHAPYASKVTFLPRPTWATDMSMQSKTKFYLGDGTDGPLLGTSIYNDGAMDWTYVHVTLDGEEWVPSSTPYVITYVLIGKDKRTLATQKLELTVTKAEQTDVPETPALNMEAPITPNSITLKEQMGGQNGVEYGYVEGTDGGTPDNWQKSPVFENLKPGTPYTFYARYAGNDYYKPSAVSTGSQTIYTAPKITMESLPDAVYNVPYSVRLTAEAQGEVSWSVDGALPEGLTFYMNTIHGTPTESGKTYEISVTATANGVTSTKTLSITVGKGTPDIDLDASGQEPYVFTYGDTITIQGTVTASSQTPATNALTGPGINQAALFLGDEQITDPVDVGADGSFTITYDTRSKGIQATGQAQDLTVKYGGSEVLDEGTGTVSITLNKASIGGAVSLSGEAAAGKTLTASYVPASGEDTDMTMTYQWYQDNQKITGATNAVYELTEADIGKSITAEVTADDGWYTGSKTSSAVICKGTQAAPDKPEKENTTTSSITVKELAANASTGASVEYSIDGGETWQTERTFTGLSSGTKYTVIARYQATDAYNASPASEGTEISTNSGGSSASTYRPDVAATKNGSVTVTPRSPEKGDKVTIKAKPDEGYEVSVVSVTDKSGKNIEVTEGKNGTYTFTQPSGKVKIKVTFQPIPAPEQPWANPFEDVAEGAWYYDAVRYARENGLMNGTGENTFSPNASTSRGMIVTILYRLAGSPDITDETGDSPYTDVDAAAYYGTAVYWARLHGIANGYDEERFGPDDAITREQLAVTLYRFAQWQGHDVTARADLSGYTDAGQISAFAREALAWANAERLVSGTSGDTLTPAGQATRAQAAAVLMRYCENIPE